MWLVKLFRVVIFPNGNDEARAEKLSRKWFDFNWKIAALNSETQGLQTTSLHQLTHIFYHLALHHFDIIRRHQIIVLDVVALFFYWHFPLLHYSASRNIYALAIKKNMIIESKKFKWQESRKIDIYTLVARRLRVRAVKAKANNPIKCTDQNLPRTHLNQSLLIRSFGILSSNDSNVYQANAWSKRFHNFSANWISTPALIEWMRNAGRKNNVQSRTSEFRVGIGAWVDCFIRFESLNST